MMLISMLIMSISLIGLTMSMFMMFNNTFIYISIPLINTQFINMPFSLILDWISCMFLSTVLMISSMIIMFSIYYITKKEHTKFLLMLLMFVLSMSILILSNNMFLMLLGWDMLGMSSYILVIYYQDNSTSGCGSITLLSNRIGDIFILLSMSMMLFNSIWELNMNETFPMIMLLMLMLAGCTKSAQFPFSAWLPMAMSAPTPISSLVHSSTLVTAGIFLMIRILNNPHPMILLVLMIISSMTAMYASMSANWQQDMKKIIALSTLSQMAMMMFAISIESVHLAYFHMIIHAFFKSLMFLCAGMMIHESSYQDMRMMSMSYLNIPMITITLGITNAALMGLPFTSGFFSKDMIIEKMISSKLECLLTLMMISSIGMTASYSLRMLNLSNNMMIKAKPDMMNHSSMYSNIPIFMMTPMAIFLGSILLWTLNPEQMLFFPSNYKFIILSTLFLGMSLGILLSFKNKTYMKMGLSAISLWFIHLLSTKPMNLFSPLMNLFQKNDKNWQESYGPYKSYMITSKPIMMPEKSKSLLLMTLLMISILPMMLMY
uniref:NADH-ubiquinone oxidoreductase chain 5 n=1 Tax=Dolomedes angustivirgatus TaxID=492287 RepID=A0A1C8V6A2_9ARAC|nr:NADH dehydrogenase subunit 5 [Dolomedes angustivirgatus]ANW36386.1 NADH dehydrogenase subunit 5 [Dolomedes angustivirgatus]